MNMYQMLSKAYTLPLKKYLFDLLQDKFQPNEEIIERALAAMTTQKDAEAFAKLAAAFYEAGYIKAHNQYKEHFKKVGYDVKLVKKNPD